MQIAVVHVITDLEIGGAEIALFRLLSSMDLERFPSRVISLTSIGPIGDQLLAAGVPVEAAHLDRGGHRVGGLIGLGRQLRHARPDVVQTWMYHADLIGGLTAKFVRSGPVAWGLRQGDLNARTTRTRTRLIARVSALLSRTVPDVIVSCTASTAAEHVGAGYASDRMVIIPNGVPEPTAAPDARSSLRRELALTDDTFVVGRVARFHEHKDYPLLFDAFGRVAAEQSGVHLVAIGAGVDEGNPVLRRLIEVHALQGRVSLLGERLDVPALMAGLDLVVSSSNGEGFPNAIAEAMSAGIPAVVTDVGISAELVGDTGWIVPSGDAPALAAALITAVESPSEELRDRGARARARVLANFGLSAMAVEYQDLYERLARRHRRRSRLRR